MKTKVWSLTTRISHWLLALGFTIAYITGENEWQMKLHYAFGALVGGILLMRIIYGIIGPKYSSFKDFPMGISHQINFIKNYFSKNDYVGHNPLASIVMLSMMIVGVLTALTGYFWANETSQLLGIPLTEDFVEGSHEILAKIFLILVFSHLAGIFFDAVFHGKMGTLKSIFSGYKNVEAEGIKSNIFDRIFSFLWIGIPLLLFYLTFGLPVREGGNENESDEESEWESLIYPGENGSENSRSFTLKLNRNSKKIDGTSGASSRKGTSATEIQPTQNMQPEPLPDVQISQNTIKPSAMSASSTSRKSGNEKYAMTNYRKGEHSDFEEEHEHHREHEYGEDDD